MTRIAYYDEAAYKAASTDVKDYRFVTSSGRSGYHKTWKNRTCSLDNLFNFLIDNLVRIYDADTCGNYDFYVRVYPIGEPEKEEFYRLKYSWYIETDPEWELIDGTECSKVKVSEISESNMERMISDRNWLFV